VIKSRRVRWAGHIVRMVQMRNLNKILVEKTEGKRLLGRPRRRLGLDTIKVNTKYI